METEPTAKMVDLAAYRSAHQEEQTDPAPSYVHLLANMPPGSREIDLLGLSIRTRNLLWRSGFKAIHKLAEASDEELLDIYRFGRGSLAEFRQRLNQFNTQHPA